MIEGGLFHRFRIPSRNVLSILPLAYSLSLSLSLAVQVRVMRGDFAAMRRELALGTAPGHTGKPMNPKVLKQFEEQEQAKDDDLEKVRLRNIHLRFGGRKEVVSGDCSLCCCLQSAES